MAIKLKIPEPCAEKWSEMAPIRQDCRHCARCARQIMDFTLKTDAEILDHLRRNDGNICGKFRHDQLNRALLEPRTIKRSGLTAIAASFAALIAAQQPATEPDFQRDTLEQHSGLARDVLDGVKNYDFSEADSIRKISGKILDAETGEAMIGATVRFSNTSIGTFADVNGLFELKIPVRMLSNVPLEIHLEYIGMLNKIVLLPPHALLEDVSLNPELTKMEPNSSMELTGIIVREKAPLKYLPRTLKLRTRHFFHQLFH